MLISLMIKKVENISLEHGVTNRCLTWLTNSAFEYEPKKEGWGVAGFSAIEYSCAHGAQINNGDLTPYLTYGFDFRGYMDVRRTIVRPCSKRGCVNV
jgi:hypothetical protein